jgi:DNA-binding response OmpR family regulator
MSKILIVEDDTFLQGLSAGRLQKEGFEVIVASTTGAGKAKLNETQFDLVLLDLMLPDAPGLEILQMMRASGSYANTPVIVFSNMSDDSEIAKATEMGATEYMVKSNFTLDEVAEKVKAHIK